MAIGRQRDAAWDTADHAPDRYERYVSWTTAGFNNLDHNRDRRITPNEWHFDRETFRRVDRNGDGALSQAEFVGSADWDDDRGDNFDDIDTNNNGQVERGEWHGSRVVFDSLDRNRDGVLSRFEVVGSQNTTGDTWDDFAALDYDRNGSLSRDEWHWSAASFNQRDRNRDGRLSRNEFGASGGAPGASRDSAARSARAGAPYGAWMAPEGTRLKGSNCAGNRRPGGAAIREGPVLHPDEARAPLQRMTGRIEGGRFHAIDALR